MNDENELLEPLATEAGQQAIVRAIRDISSLEYAVRAELAASLASAKAGEASQSALEASEAEDKAKDWATKTDTYVEQETITIPPAQEGEEPTTETINLYSAKYYAALAQDIYNNMSFDQVPTENSTNMVNSGTVYSALDLKADKSTIYTKTEVDTALSAKADLSTTYTKTEVDTALSNVQSTLTFDNVPTANSDNPVKSSGIKTALDSKQDTLTFDSTPTANSTNPVTSGGVYTALQNVDANIEVDDEITEDSDNPVTSAAIYEALLNFTPSGDVGGAGNASGVVRDLLYENSEGLSSGTITLNKSWKDYDVIEIDYSGQNWSVSLPVYHNVNKIKSEGYISAYTDETSDSIKFFDLKVVSGSDTQLTVDGSRFFVCRKIYGIKFSKNLSEQMYSNVLYENSSGANTGNIILSDSYKNYDFIGFNFSLLAESPASNSPIQNSSIVSVQQLEDSKVGKFSIHGFDNRSTHFIIVNDTTFNCTLTENGQKISKIYGIKLAKGGYSGIVSDARMTVKSGTVTLGNNLSANSDYKYNITFDSPMPDANYIIQLSGSNLSAYWANINYTTKDKTVNGFTVVVWATHAINESHTLDWIAIRPNSYTREGMVEDVLFSNASGVNSGTINLSGNISDYDLICFVYNTNGGSSNLFKQHYYINPSNLSVGDKVSLTGYDNRYIDVQLVSDLSLSITGRNEHTLIKIIGIKFGRYVSGVAVDTTVTQNSDAVITSGAVYDALQNIPSGGGGGGSITLDSIPIENSTNGITSGAVWNALVNRFAPDFSGDIPNDMKVENADQLLFQNGSSNNYYKKYNGIAAGAVVILPDNFVSAILVSTNENNVIQYSSNNLSVAHTIIYDNKTFYYSGSVNTLRTNMNPRNFSIRWTSTWFASEEAAARYILDLVLSAPSRTLANYNITNAYTKTEVDTLLQNAGGSSITVDSTITQGGTNPVEGGAIYTALGDKADQSTTYTKTEVDTALASKGDVTTDTAQNITGTKTFVGSKKVAFKLSAANDKLGFTLFGNTGTERGYLEFNPTNTVDGVAGLMTLGNYATSAAGLTQVGFRRYSNISGASGAYNLLMPMVADARTPFSLTTSYQNFYLPLGFTNGTTTVKTAKSGLVDLSPLLASLEARIAALEGN